MNLLSAAFRRRVGSTILVGLNFIRVSSSWFCCLLIHNESALGPPRRHAALGRETLSWEMGKGILFRELETGRGGVMHGCC